ncbi:PDZ domain-containing protein [Maridesulfovibrio zosterae]|uniref:PDZ domain-containing protein n=1 Tax=Maridesulfovibrio zosterae TaxID=82171 RepID=UPI001FE20076|nr:PDZ domain-containing protein [Maridesulfovibrio zosterae]
MNGNTGCGVDPTTRIFKKTEVEDFSQMGWLEAYDAFHALMQKQYAFGDWKGIDWSALDNSIRPKVVIAEAAAAGDDYIKALLEYTRSIPDGHISWNNPIFGIIEPNIKGSYGLGMIGLDDGKVIANVITGGGPAANALIDVGSEILEWNDVAIATAAAQVSTLWRPNPGSIAIMNLSCLNSTEPSRLIL